MGNKRFGKLSVWIEVSTEVNKCGIQVIKTLLESLIIKLHCPMW